MSDYFTSTIDPLISTLSDLKEQPNLPVVFFIDNSIINDDASTVVRSYRAHVSDVVEYKDIVYDDREMLLETLEDELFANTPDGTPWESVSDQIKMQAEELCDRLPWEKHLVISL